MANYAQVGGTHIQAGILAPFPTVANGGTAGVYTPSGSIFIAAVLDSDKAHWFSTDGNISGPNLLPTLKSIAQIQYADTGELSSGTAALKGGGFLVTVKLGPFNLAEANSPQTYALSESGMLVIASTSVG